ncbi:hypothetical protein AB0K21_35285 [Streptosporangium sp. NPDC049248]|uniref:hypothetical protein n=1 Tax=Streptosporangium sp. NPDC049248 TaxID=3155651 RepID=UPI00341E5CF2
MTRMIERWFPCAEVSAATASGWGSGKSEKALFTWFAARPLAQAKAAVLTSLLPWSEDEGEQKRLQQLVRDAMTARDAKHAELVAEIAKTHPDGASMLDPFSGRAMIPLEGARLGVQAHGVDYSPVAALAGSLLADYPLRDWSNEPSLPFRDRDQLETSRLLDDVTAFLDEIGRRYAAAVADIYPAVDGAQPWGYVWAQTLPCQECARRFPLTGSLVLRHPLPAKNDPGQSYRIDVDRAAGTFTVVVHDGAPIQQPTLVARTRDGKAIKGKSAICPFCSHPHLKQVHQRLAQERLAQDVLLVAADLDPKVGKVFRQPTDEERAAADLASKLLAEEPSFGWIPAVPDEGIPVGNSDTVRASVYGARTYGDLCNARQTLGFVRLARVIADTATELKAHGISDDYAAALAGYAGSVFVRKIKRSTRGTALLPHNHATSNRVQTNHIFQNEASLSFGYDYFETGLGDGPGTWPSLADDTVTVIRNQAARAVGRPANLQRGSALSLPFRDSSLSAVVTDPPYDDMIDYSDASDLFYVWLKRALHTTAPSFAITSHPQGVQEKADEVIVKRFRAWKTDTDHRTREHYDSSIAKAFSEARRVVRDDGVVTIVFGHGDPEVWQRLLGAINQAQLVLTGSWPAKTEAGGGAGAANIVTTLTMSCRPAPPERPSGRKGAVEAEIKTEIKRRYPDWERWGLAPADMLMAAAGPAMEVVGRYREVLDSRGEPVDIYTFLPLARAAVQEAMAVEIDHHPLETFDARTRFALWWVRLYGRQVQAKSELRWQTLASSMDLAEVRDLVPNASKGVRFTAAQQFNARINGESAVIDVALALATASEDGLAAMGEVLATSGRGADDAYLWAAVQFLADRLPDSDPDAIAFSRVRRARDGIANAAELVIAGDEVRQQRQLDEDSQMRLL